VSHADAASTADAVNELIRSSGEEVNNWNVGALVIDEGAFISSANALGISQTEYAVFLRFPTVTAGDAVGAGDLSHEDSPVVDG
jgi:hypothetical protein